MHQATNQALQQHIHALTTEKQALAAEVRASCTRSLRCGGVLMPVVQLRKRSAAPAHIDAAEEEIRQLQSERDEMGQAMVRCRRSRAMGLHALTPAPMAGCTARSGANADEGARNSSGRARDTSGAHPDARAAAASA